MLLFFKVFSLLITLSVGAWLAVRLLGGLAQATKAMHDGRPYRFPLPHLGLWALWIAMAILFAWLQWGYRPG
jgi:hypothetical protein